MVSFLTQIRAGYIARRQHAFPSSVVLVGMRTVRDVVSWLGTSSPFNISAEAVSLGAFSQADVAELVGQHTAATGQLFEPEAISTIWNLAQGHPWLTNALADEAVNHEAPDRNLPITQKHIEAAKETLILERRSHIDSLVARLHEPRIVRILAPMLQGERAISEGFLQDDLAYAVDMGILRLCQGQYEVDNPIYREVIPRALTFEQQTQIQEPTARYVQPNGELDVPKLMAAWQVFWRTDGHLAAEGFGYREAGPHLMLMAFLQRVINGGGQIHREYGLGRGALDILIQWKSQRFAIEVKLRRDNHTEGLALAQLNRYLDHLGLGEGYLVLFDLRKEVEWEEKLTTRTVDVLGKTVHVVGC
ncbi:MAG: hypothetical protein IPK82_22835 [Polyangiaceae bacterium]|nr:hypothetical protein [Polyangiaceae bacterium]